MISSCVVLTLTGSDSGFGHALAKHLDKLGFTVFAGVLNEAGLGAEELRKTCSERLSVLQMDVTKPEQIKDTLSKVTEKIKDKGTNFLILSHHGHQGHLLSQPPMTMAADCTRGHLSPCSVAEPERHKDVTNDSDIRPVFIEFGVCAWAGVHACVGVCCVCKGQKATLAIVSNVSPILAFEIGSLIIPDLTS